MSSPQTAGRGATPSPRPARPPASPPVGAGGHPERAQVDAHEPVLPGAEAASGPRGGRPLAVETSAVLAVCGQASGREGAGKTSPPLATMTAEQAGWVRQHVWTGAMRKTYREVPGLYAKCACQSGLSSWCSHLGRCERCHRGTPAPSHVTVICKADGIHCAQFADPYANKTWSATGYYPSHLALVWHADRVCRWICPCDCHSAPAAPEQLDLFAEAS